MKKLRSLSMYWSLLRTHLKPQKNAFVALGLLLVASVGFRVGAPRIMRSFIDSVLAGKPLGALLAAAGAFIAVAFAQQFMQLATSYFGEKIAWRATNALRGELAAHALNLDMHFHNNTSPGQLIERIDGDVTELSNFFSFFTLMIVTNVLMLAGVIGMLFVEDWRAGLGFSVFLALSITVLSRFNNVARPFVKKRREIFTSMFGEMEEHLAGTEDLRGCGAGDYPVARLVDYSSKLIKVQKSTASRIFVLNGSVDAVLGLGMLGTMILSYRLYVAGSITIGTAYLFIHYLELLHEPIWGLTRQMESFQTIGACVERLNEFKEAKSKLRQVGLCAVSKPEAATVLACGAIELEFRNVSFSYTEERSVLRDVSFRVAPGAVLGVLGRTGSGKSTVVRLVSRLYDPSEGSIRYNGLTAHEMPEPELRRAVAMVTQDVQLFRASVRDNLTFFDRTVPDEALLEAVETLGLSPWLSRQNEGLDTIIESGGRGLSAGEAQLLAFTRVFLRNPALVILDEASSRLDPATEQILERAVDKLLSGRSGIVIAHRLATVRRVDEILILDEGRVAEYGSRMELMQNPGSRFSALLAAGMEEVLA